MIGVRSVKAMKSGGIVSLPTAKIGPGNCKTNEKFNQMLVKYQL